MDRDATPGESATPRASTDLHAKWEYAQSERWLRAVDGEWLANDIPQWIANVQTVLEIVEKTEQPTGRRGRIPGRMGQIAWLQWTIERLNERSQDNLWHAICDNRSPVPVVNRDRGHKAAEGLRLERGRMRASGLPAGQEGRTQVLIAALAGVVRGRESIRTTRKALEETPDWFLQGWYGSRPPCGDPRPVVDALLTVWTSADGHAWSSYDGRCAGSWWRGSRDLSTKKRTSEWCGEYRRRWSAETGFMRIELTERSAKLAKLLGRQDWIERQVLEPTGASCHLLQR
jgi:hypothetical protein